MIKVSVVVPIYNSEEYLQRCVESILKQTLKEIEIILIDDGSTDASYKMCQEYEKNNANVKVKHTKNQGLTKARTEGIEISSGEYIAFVDSDDWVREDMYEKLYNEAKRLNVDIIQCGFEKTQNTDKVIEKHEVTETRIYSAENSIMQLLGIEERQEFNFIVWNKLYKYQVLKGVKFPIHIRTNEDVATTPRVFYEAKSIAVTDERFVYYFQRNNPANKSIMDELRMSREKFIISHLRAFYDVSLYFKDLDRKIYLASLKCTITWALSALTQKDISKEYKKEAIKIIKKSSIIGYKYLPLKKKLAATLFKIVAHIQKGGVANVR